VSALCRERGIQLRVEGGKLLYTAPIGAYTFELRDLVNSCRAELLAELSSQPVELSPQPWPPRPAELATWPIAKRQRWGERANALEDEGLCWKDAERQAFLEVQATE
jgi:hypothetical protein